MKIREMTASDCRELSELDKICFAVPWSEQLFFEETQNEAATYYVAEENGKIAGYIGFWKVCGETQVTNVAVLPEMRRHKIATALIEKMISKSEGNIVLEVRESNTPAISLYEKFGFKRAGIRKNFYRSPVENGIVMILGEN